MGIQGLLPFLKSIHRESHLRNWAGKTLAVDGYVWLHRGAYSCAEELCLGKPTTRHVDYFLQRINLLRRNNVSAYVVFDGDHLPSKKLTEDDRENRRKIALTNAKKFLAQGNTKNARDEFVKAVDITPQLAHDVIVALRSAGVKYVVAPYEADAQLRYLEMKGEVDAIITEDSDLLVYGARNVLFKLDPSGHCVHIRRDEFGLVEDKRMATWTDAEFRQMAMLSGCDYLSSITGLGIIKAHDLIRKFKTAERAIKATRLDGKLTVPLKYELAFKEAELTFLHQFVYDSTMRSMVPLHPLPDPPPAIEYLAGCGEKWPDQVAIDVAEGRLDPLTKEVLSAQSPVIKPLPRQARVLDQKTPVRASHKIAPGRLSQKRPTVNSSQQPTLKQFSFSSTPNTASLNSARSRNVLKSIGNQNTKPSEEQKPIDEKLSKFFEDRSNKVAVPSFSPSFEPGHESQGFISTQTTNEEPAQQPFTQETWDAISDVPTDGSVSGKVEEVRQEMQLEHLAEEDLQSSQMYDYPTLPRTTGSIPNHKTNPSRSQSPLSSCSTTVTNKEIQDPTSKNYPHDSSVCLESSQEIQDQTFTKFSDSDIISSEPDEYPPTFVKPRVTIITPNNHHATTVVLNHRRVSEPISHHTNQFPISSDPILNSDNDHEHDKISNAVFNRPKTIQSFGRVQQGYKKSSQGFIETPLSKLSKGVKRSAPDAQHEQEISPSLARVATGIRDRFTYQKPPGNDKQKLFDFSKYKKENKASSSSSSSGSKKRASEVRSVFATTEPKAVTSDPASSNQDINHQLLDYQIEPRKSPKKLALNSSTNVITPVKPPLKNTYTSSSSSNYKLSSFLFKGNVDHLSYGV